MKKELFALLACVITITANAQSFNWAKSFGPVSSFDIRSIIHDDQGNIYTMGTMYDGPFDIDPGSGVDMMSSSGQFIFIQKLDANGNFIWAKNLDRSAGYTAYACALASDFLLTKNGLLVVSGYFQGNVDFDPGPGAFELNIGAPTRNGFIFALDTSGNFLWADRFSSPFDCFIPSMTADDTGNIICTTEFDHDLDADPGPGTVTLATSVPSSALIKLNSSGDFVWQKRLSFRPDKIRINENNNNIYLTGIFSDTADFDPGPGTYHILSPIGGLFIAEFDPAINFMWARSFGGVTGYDMILGPDDISFDKTNHIYLSGYFRGNVNISTNSTPIYLNANKGEYLLKMDSTGANVWSWAMDSIYSNTVAVKVDTFSNIYIAGTVFGAYDFNPGSEAYMLTGSLTKGNEFLVKLNDSCQFSWGYIIGGSNGTQCFAIDLDKVGNIYFAGAFQFTSDFDPGTGIYNMTGAVYPNASIFQEKLSQCVPIGMSVSIVSSGGTVVTSGSTDTFVATVYPSGVLVNYQWYVNGSIVPAGTSSIYTSSSLANSDSVYCIITPVDTCSNNPFYVSNGISMTVLGITSVTDINKPSNYLVYPNPCKGTLNVDIQNVPQHIQSSYIITDVLGRQIQVGKLTAQYGNINSFIQLSDQIANGVYLLNTLMGDNKTVTKLIVER